ncbi:hypothetical protein MVI01_13630 [Myxococcus virescens]|uniref:Uncharacterized protein n=1 Tax=Myxococcus virescens TaxID=83456 RepID=A0A511HA32_9BACT|nr:hypothetical protein MVI01_13630 [Myxococcus virescens]
MTEALPSSPSVSRTGGRAGEAFRHFGGVSRVVLGDDARALVEDRTGFLLELKE